jgi:hypothetical protein
MMLATTTLAAMMALAGAAAESRRPWMQELRAAPPEVRARSLLAKMTLAEKLVMLHGHTNRTGCPGPTCAGLPYRGTPASIFHRLPSTMGLRASVTI